MITNFAKKTKATHGTRVPLILSADGKPDGDDEAGPADPGDDPDGEAAAALSSKAEVKSEGKSPPSARKRKRGGVLVARRTLPPGVDSGADSGAGAMEGRGHVPWCCVPLMHFPIGSKGVGPTSENLQSLERPILRAPCTRPTHLSTHTHT